MFSSNASQVSSAANYIEDVFSTYLYTGNGSSQTITNGIDLSTKGGLVWIKNRTTAGTNNVLTDTARGAGFRLFSDTTAAQANGSGTPSFTSTGFGLATASSNLNASSDNYASWTFRKQPKFFDVVTYTGNGGTQSIAHNLGSVPGCIIVKPVSAAGAWPVYHRSINIDYPSYLNTTAAATGPNTIFGIAPTSTQFYVWTSNETNQSGVQYVAYLFAHNAGGFGLTGTDNVISCGSFTTSGAGTASVNLGYEPQYLMLKNTSAVDNWYVLDNMRGMSMTQGNDLDPNLSAAEGTYWGGGTLVPTSTGFSIPVNIGASQTYIYMAIRRGPMKVPTDATNVYSVETHTGPILGTKSTYTTGFPVDMVWEAVRQPGGTGKFLVTDRLRVGSGTTTSNTLQTSSTISETTINGYASLFFDNSTGYSVTDGNGSWNGSTIFTPAASWSFRRAPGFFDEVCYTGTGASNTLTHNLNVAPELIIIKSRNNAYSWSVGSKFTGSNFVYNTLESTDAGATFTYSSGVVFNGQPSASSVFLNSSGGTNQSGATYVAYLFATCAGVSKVGSYTGTGATQTISCGFTGGARFVLIKRTDSTGDWYIWDTARGMVSGTDPNLQLNTTNAETNSNDVYTTTGGFQIVSTAAGINASGGSYIFLAIA